MSGVTVDTSAVLAILHEEPETAALVEELRVADTRLISAATYVELGLVLEARGSGVSVERVARDWDFTLVPVDAEHSSRALDAWRRYGKGRHPAGLNYGDCFVYGLAESTRTPILAVGRDFAKTDLDVVPGR